MTEFGPAGVALIMFIGAILALLILYAALGKARQR